MKKYLYLFVSLMVFSASLGAAEMSNGMKRTMYGDILQLLNDYEEYSSMLESDYARMFRNLFESEDSRVYNDLMSAGGAEMISAGEYSRLLSSEVAPGSRLFLTNVRHGEPVSEDNISWVIPVTFGKSSLYFDECDIRYSSKDYYNSEYVECMSVVWNSQDRTCLIREISGSIDTEVSRLPDGFVVLKRTDDVRNDNLLLDGQPVQWDNADISYLDGTVLTDRRRLSYPDNDVELRVSRDASCSRVLHLKYKPKRWRFGVFYNAGLISEPLSLKMSDGITSSSGGYGIGAEIGYVFKSKRKLRTGIFTGAGISRYTITSDMPDMQYCYNASGSEDMDGDSYRRYYSVRNMKYTCSVVDVTIPLYFDFDFKLSGILHFYLDAGVEANLNSEQKVDDISADYSVYGIYSKYNNLRIDYSTLHNMGASMNGFVDDGRLSADDISEKTLGLASFTLDAVAGLGFRFDLSRSVRVLKDISLGVGVYYRYGLMNYCDNHRTFNSNLHSTSNPTDRAEAPVSYSLSEGETVVNVSEYIGEMSRSGSIMNKFSITYRF